VPPPSDLNGPNPRKTEPGNTDRIAIVFASGSERLNRELIDRVAAQHPELPLFVVGEFEPHQGQWIPYHVFRRFNENLAAIRAAIGTRRIAFADLVFDPAIPHRKMRLAAAIVAPWTVIGWGKYLARRAGDAAVSPRAKRWLGRLRDPSDAELPARARAAQLYGIAASRVRVRQTEAPMRGAHPLAPGVTVVIPSRNGKELLSTLLPALVPQVTEGEIVVSDNGSNDGTRDWLASNFPSVRIIHTPGPLSFGRAVNAGILSARCSHVLLLNNDMVVGPGFVAALQAAFDKVPDLFCATAQIFFPPGIRREETGKAVWRRENPLDFPVRCDDPVPGEDLTWVLYGSGGCSLFDTEKLRSLGGVSEVYDPAYVEDLDFGYRGWKRGWPSVFVAGARVEHRHRATTARYYTPEQLDNFVEINYLRFLIHAVGSPALFRTLWTQAIRRLQLKGAIDALRRIPHIGPQPLAAQGNFTEPEILALGSGDVAVFPGHASSAGKPVVIASPYLPFPLSHGGAVRIYNLMRQGAASRDQILIAFTDVLSTPPAELLAICREVILVRRHGTHYRRDTPRPDVVEEFASESFRACLKQVVHQWRPGLVQLEFTQMAQYAKDCVPARTLLIEHDITFDLQQQLLTNTNETGAALLEMQKQLARWQAFETVSWKQVDCVVTMSLKDEAAVTGAKRVVCLPNGVDTERFQPDGGEPEPRRLLFIGSFAHLPNLLALEYFLGKVWPLLGGEFKLHVIAGDRYEYFRDFHRTQVSPDLSLPGLEIEGFVSDVRGAYRRAELVIAPLTASAGTNIKVIEAMAMGRVVISTPAGVNGLDVTPGNDVIVTYAAREMAEQIRTLSVDADSRRTIEHAARATALRYDWREIAKAQSKLYEELSADNHFS
jgi:GT2 family glycosyltransferase/glycosyltransferase involved in cell wall biosynthesis